MGSKKSLDKQPTSCLRSNQNLYNKIKKRTNASRKIRLASCGHIRRMNQIGLQDTVAKKKVKTRPMYFKEMYKNLKEAGVDEG